MNELRWVRQSARVAFFAAWVVGIGGFAQPGRASVRPDFYVSLLSDTGVEVVSDERVFALFAALNDLGYNLAPLARKEPIPRAAYAPVRAQVRATALMADPLAQKFQAFMDQHPEPLTTYVAFTQALGPAPDFAVVGKLSGRAEGLTGFQKLLAQFYADAKLGPLYLGLAETLRKNLLSYLPQIDPAFGQADRFLPKAGTPPVVVINWLDSPTSGFSLSEGGEPTVVVGQPAMTGKSADLSEAVAGYARILCAPALSSKAKNINKSLSDLIDRAKRQGQPAGNLTPAEYLIDSFGYAVAAEALPDQRSATLARANEQGLALASELDRLMQEAKTANAFDEVTGDKLTALDFRRVGSAGP
jgi:hypothetical protein